jgi:hypothetical protein
MQIIICDLHARQQALAMLDTTTGKVVKKAEARRQQRAGVLLQPSTTGACGNRSHCIDAVVCEPHGRAGNRVSGGSSGRDSSG